MLFWLCTTNIKSRLFGIFSQGKLKKITLLMNFQYSFIKALIFKSWENYYKIHFTMFIYIKNIEKIY